ncbi:acyl dehydratase [Nesterenkonia sp. LB17]|uniref:MaoC/PaaZ C-terminal domain-containing protein n=1 Tax=unclassified Nesterenkonia TaxID=2629769 RepID=UPI001F4D0F72|nr:MULTISPECIES: MaoC/PaaZ C-terminal domain-containing protein [unclassified Nesterenkonia]MCH8560572.1 acyl dehydratase [Nesterenkonia sp. DZ6]MCH8562839.1 acyl dehydratase [Nesterenkonia sp. YGD6]MCH8565888.1 acyl dehydratase [Nesterenkonia sp. LB17]MCH8570680.1 acyl dehydratase [Nesterenkonia sp. AY15]
MSTPVFEDLQKGQQIGTRELSFSRADLIRYAAASGDHNPIHWNDRFAREVGLDGVIAHGMLTMGSAVDLVSVWAGDPGAVVDYQSRFTKPVPVPDAASGSPETATARLQISGKIGAVDAQQRRVRVDLSVELLTEAATEAGPDQQSHQEPVRTKVLAKSQALVQF